MKTDHTSGFVVEDITVGPFAHGFGTTDDGHPYAFRTVRATLTLEIYRSDTDTAVPGPDDVVAVAEARVTDIDLDDERSITALVRDLIPAAAPIPAIDRGPTTVRALLGRLGAVIDGM
ncbi:hypothetical protein [Nocardia transvalensis]|uniref:hypothetical protein n=1 Tax=Nocardia transvalensis TaxID=37333 RepID=UPI001895F5B5|nr:hypothetical protein [Nocardia transvalensis]MBF6328382.1 hypothetical protein [Nocardia transvalensis]